MNQKLLGVLTASFLIGAFLVSVSASFLQQSAEVALDARTVGEEVYVTYCASCHGDLGEGDGPAAYAFAAEGNEVTNFILEVSELVRTFKTYQYGLNAAGVPTDESLHETILYGRSDGAMPAFPLLSVAQREAVIAYIKTFRSNGWPSASDVADAEALDAAPIEAPEVNNEAVDDQASDDSEMDTSNSAESDEAPSETDSDAADGDSVDDDQHSEDDESSTDSE
jgi:mono/diheme cytochrome c family protein